jgi:galactokinase
MNDSHISLRDNYELVVTELDSMVTEVWKIDGVIGSRMRREGILVFVLFHWLEKKQLIFL